MVYSSDNEMFKLKAKDAKERQHWVNVLRIISQSCKDNEPPKPQIAVKPDNNNRPSTSSRKERLEKFSVTLSKIKSLKVFLFCFYFRPLSRNGKSDIDLAKS